MAMKSPEATIDFLICCIDNMDGKVNWEDVAVKTGWYKSGKFSRQAYTNIQKKYSGTVIGADPDASADAPPKTPKKRVAKPKGEETGSNKKAKKEVDDKNGEEEDDSVKNDKQADVEAE